MDRSSLVPPCFLAPYSSNEPFTTLLSGQRQFQYAPQLRSLSTPKRPRPCCQTIVCTAEPSAKQSKIPPPSSTSASDETKLASPPSTFYQAITDAQQATMQAINAGNQLIEIEFPPLPTQVMESTSVSSYDVSDANLRLAIDYAKKFISKDNPSEEVVIVLPDWIEKKRAMDMYNSTEQLQKGLRLGCIKDEKKAGFFERIWVKSEIDIAIRPNDKMYIIINVTTQELPDVERLFQKIPSNTPLVLFNLKLDSCRGDLGLPAFPKRAFHYRFLSKVQPIYYLRTRSYSRSMARPPYVVNYSGALFKVFPGDYQILLDQSGGKYRRVSWTKERPTLGEVRDELTDALNVEGLKGKNSGFLGRGYKSSTWWEDDRTKQESNKWRE